MNPAEHLPLRESDRIEQELRKKILSLEIEPGLAIIEASLIKRYKWGRTPLREAFQRLSEQSLLCMIPRHGIVVTPLSVFDFVEVMDAMSMVIGPAASLACKHITEAELQQLDHSLAESRIASEKGDFTSVAEQDYEFHQVLAFATGNRYLSRHLLYLHQVATRFNLAAWKRDSNTSFSLEEHERIVSAFHRHDEVAAQAVMIEHIENARRRIMGTFQPLSSP